VKTQHRIPKKYEQHRPKQKTTLQSKQNKTNTIKIYECVCGGGGTCKG